MLYPLSYEGGHVTLPFGAAILRTGPTVRLCEKLQSTLNSYF